jgi:thiol-disulfide isomerase/thioredoxin
MYPHRLFARRLIVATLVVAGLASCYFVGEARRTHATMGPIPANLEESLTLPSTWQERPSLAGGIDWINTDRPIHLEKLRGKIVLLDFWTYCCINCHHIIPTLSKLEEKYKNQLVVVGVHTAKFEAEKLTANIRKKVREYNIKHPVVNDANQVIWNNFGVSSWPTLVLIGPDGLVVDKAGGEVSFEVLDRVIGKLVQAAKSKGQLDETPVQFFSEREKTHSGGLLFPGKVLADRESNRLFISDTGHNRIVVTDLAGSFKEAIGNGVEGLADGPFDKAMLNRPQGTCLVDGILYVADTENHAIRAVDFKAKTVTTLVGNGKQANFGTHGGKGTKTSLSSPWDLVLIPNSKTLAVAMAGTHQVWKFHIEGDDARLWAGSGQENIVDGTLLAANFAQPSGLATDGHFIFVADSEVSGVREISLGRKEQVQTIVGVGLFGFGDVDGRGANVRLQHCLGLTYGDKKLFIADSYNNKIKVCDPATRAVETLVGSTAPGSTDEPARFDEPGGLSIAGNDLYVADTNNHLIRVVGLDSKKVKTLALDGVKAPSVKRVPKFPNATVVSVDPVQAGLDKSLSLTISLNLPPGYDLNTQASMTYLVETPEKPGALSDKNPTTGGRIDPPTPSVVVPLPLASEPAAGETLNVKVSLSAMVCLPNTLCTVRNYVWNVPITFTAGAPSQVTLGRK